MGTLATAAIERALIAAAALVEPPPAVAVDPIAAEQSVRSERFMRVRGAPLEGFAPLSRFFAAADGWVRTHANYPWHREALLRTFATDADGLEARLAELPAADIEERAYAAGALAVRVRTSLEWLQNGDSHSNKTVTAAHIRDKGTHKSVTRAGDAPPRTPRATPTAQQPLAGLRVLDLTRVIAGPTGTRYLGALGADVLRLDPPHRPELDIARHDGLLAKRSALLDLGSEPARLQALLEGADVLVTGYRPGALDAFGLAPAALAETHPGLVIVTLSAWGHTPGWEHRRGFDSLVQAATGIAHERAAGDRPGALPCQLLDHASGYLIAASACELVREQRTSGGTHHARIALADTAAHVLAHPDAVGADPPAPALTAFGDLEVVPPAGALDGVPLRWPGPPPAYGASAAAWQ